MGNIYVWAAGNGAAGGDNVNYDGYANSRYAIAVSAVDHDGEHAVYSEPGAPVLVAGYSATTLTYPAADYAGVFTTTVQGYGDATFYLGGDVDYTARAYGHVGGGSGGIGRRGADVAGKPEPHLAGCATHPREFGPPRRSHRPRLDDQPRRTPDQLQLRLWCRRRNSRGQYGQDVDQRRSGIDGVDRLGDSRPDVYRTPMPRAYRPRSSYPQAIKIEKIEVVLNATHTWRGDLRAVLISPWGTESVLAAMHGDSGANYSNWVFTTVRDWDEISYGDWTLKITDGAGGDVGTFNSWQLNFYGTTSTAQDFGDAPSSYGTLTANDGARHVIGGLNLGTKVDWEANGQPTADASGDGAEEDGVRFVEPVVAGETARVLVTSRPGGGVLDLLL